MLSNVPDSHFYPECNTERGFIDQLYIELGLKQSNTNFWLMNFCRVRASQIIFMYVLVLKPIVKNILKYLNGIPWKQNSFRVSGINFARFYSCGTYIEFFLKSNLILFFIIQTAAMMLKGTILIVLAIGINVTLVSGKFTFMFLQEFKHKDDQ